MSRSCTIKHWKSLPRPTCCTKIIDYPIINLASTTTEGEAENPRWLMQVETPYPRNIHRESNVNGYFDFVPQNIEMDKCPFCSTKLPEVELKTRMPKNIMTITDGGYYCDTCKDRLNCCDCYPSEAKYKVKKI